MFELINNCKNLILHSEKLLSQKCVSEKEYIDYKNQCDAQFSCLISLNINYTLSELSKMGLEFEVKRIKNPFYRWLYFLLTTARDNITFNAPYLKGHTESDYNKQYIFWTKARLEGILFNLKRLNRKDVPN